jgi:hypothetical protein
MSQTHVDTYIALHADFVSLARSMSDAKLEQPPKNGEWSAAYVLHHLADADMHFATRFLNILTVENPAIVGFDEDVYPDRLHYKNRSAVDSLAAIEGISKAIANILTLADENDWKRTGIHSEKGAVTLLDILNLTTGHVKGHTEQLKEIISSF